MENTETLYDLTKTNKRAHDTDLLENNNDIITKQPLNILDSLKEELSKKVSLPPITLPVLSRAGLKVRFNCNIESKDLQRLSKLSKINKAKNATPEENVDELRLSCLIIANYSDAILKDDVEVIGEDGKVYNFRHPELLEMVHAENASDAVKKFYGVDGYILQTAQKIVASAGYDPENIESDEENAVFLPQSDGLNQTQE